jgi:hypothetical protein
MMRTQPRDPREQFKDFQATSLFCPKCRVAMPVRERLLLVLPDGDLFEYVCARCATSVGKRRAQHPTGITVV